MTNCIKCTDSNNCIACDLTTKLDSVNKNCIIDCSYDTNSIYNLPRIYSKLIILIINIFLFLKKRSFSLD